MKEGIKKLYYSSGDVCEMVDIDKNTLFRWEKEFPDLKPARKIKGNGRGASFAEDRRYTPKDLELIKYIKRLVQEQKLNITGAKMVLNKVHSSESQLQKTIESLLELKSFLLKIKEDL